MAVYCLHLANRNIYFFEDYQIFIEADSHNLVLEKVPKIFCFYGIKNEFFHNNTRML